MKLKKIRNILCIAVLLIAAAGTFVLFAYPRFVEPVVKYNEAQSLYESGDYLRAAMQFSALGGKRDSAQKAADAWCSAGEAALARGDAETAYACFKSAGMPEAEQLRQDECFFELGKNAYAAGDYNRAEICFDSITDKAGFAARTDEVRIAAAESFLSAGEMPQAMRCFSLCSDESKSNICRIYITQGENLLQNFEIESAYKCFNGAKNNCSDDALADLLQKINSAWESAGQRAMEAGKYEIATECYSMSDGFSPDEVIAERDAARYEKAVEAYQKNNYLEALTLLNSVSEDYEQSADMIAEILKMLQSTPAAGGKDFYALRNLDGTVSLTGSGWKGETVSWSGIRSIAVGRENFILGLRANGTVAAAGKSSYDRTGVGSWTNIVQVACGLNHSLGLRSDGTVVSCGWNYYGQRITETWAGVVYIAAGNNTSYGVLSSGRVIAIGDNSSGQCNVSEWRGVAAVSAGYMHAVGLKSDGTALACGANNSGQCNVSEWEDLTMIAAGAYHTVGLKSDGTLVACGSNTFGECNVSGFHNVAAVSAGERFTLITFKDGSSTVVGNFDAGQSNP